MRIPVSALLEKIDCPRCQAPGSFGPRQVFGQFWVARCRKCKCYRDEPLPSVKKQIIYLDQFVLSNILAAKEPRWRELYQRLKVLSGLETVVCPVSRIHRDESLLATSSRDALKALYRDLGGEDEFLSTSEIAQNQLLRRMTDFLDGTPPSDDFESWTEYAKMDPHRWTVGFAVFTDFPLRPETVADLQSQKDRLHADLTSVADYWKTEPAKFPEDVRREALAYGSSLLELYREMAGGRKRIETTIPAYLPEMKEAFEAAFGPDRFNPDMPPGWQPGVMLVHWLAAKVYRRDPNIGDPLPVVVQFFASEYATTAPFLYISSRLEAELAQRVRSAKGARVPKASDSFDVSAIAHYAPYCDAMIVDNEFFGMATQKNIDLPGRFGVRLFCARTLPDFMAYLDESLFNIPLGHRKILKEIYPDLAWLPILKTD